MSSLAWSQIPHKPSESLSSHLYAHDLIKGTALPLHLIDTTVSDHGRTRLTSWLLTQPPDPKVGTAANTLVKELAPRSLFRDRLVLEANLAGEQEPTVADWQRCSSIRQFWLD